MSGPWKNEEELLQCLLYWQNRALQSEKEREYFKQQFLDKDKEIKHLMYKASFITGGE
jgi:hypothetical protein